MSCPPVVAARGHEVARDYVRYVRAKTVYNLASFRRVSRQQDNKADTVKAHDESLKLTFMGRLEHLARRHQREYRVSR